MSSAENISDRNNVRLPELMDLARRGGAQALGDLLQLYRNYLTILATTQFDRRLRRRMNPSDLVQETMLAAHQDFEAFRGGSEAELLAWLRQILVNCLRAAVDTHFNAQKRDMRREVSIVDSGYELSQFSGVAGGGRSGAIAVWRRA